MLQLTLQGPEVTMSDNFKMLLTSDLCVWIFYDAIYNYFLDDEVLGRYLQELKLGDISCRMVAKLRETNCIN